MTKSNIKQLKAQVQTLVIKQLKAQAETLVRLLEDPQPGLLTWNKAVWELIDAIAAYRAQRGQLGGYDQGEVKTSPERLEADPAA